MPIRQRLRDLLDQRGVEYLGVTHSPACTAQAIAQSMHTPGREVAKVVVVKHAGKLALAVLPAHARVDLERLGAALHGEVVLASEREFAAAFPDCELGAMPPFGGRYGLRTWVDESLTRDQEIAFNAGTHADAFRMSFEDYRRLAAPVVLWLAGEPAGAEG
jgi:Ala-tRNA(Pro) deacylase